MMMMVMMMHYLRLFPPLLSHGNPESNISHRKCIPAISLVAMKSETRACIRVHVLWSPAALDVHQHKQSQIFMWVGFTRGSAALVAPDLTIIGATSS